MEEDYEVEKILCKRQDKGKWYYLIKWLGYDYDECTWEPAINISKDCKELVRDFELEQERNQNQKNGNSNPPQEKEKNLELNKNNDKNKNQVNQSENNKVFFEEIDIRNSDDEEKLKKLKSKKVSSKKKDKNNVYQKSMKKNKKIVKKSDINEEIFSKNQNILPNKKNDQESKEQNGLFDSINSHFMKENSNLTSNKNINIQQIQEEANKTKPDVNLSLKKIKITDHFVINKNMYFLIIEEGDRNVGFFSLEYCKKLIPLELCDYFIKFIKF